MKAMENKTEDRSRSESEARLLGATEQRLRNEENSRGRILQAAAFCFVLLAFCLVAMDFSKLIG
jgi:hypothetical protein